MARTYVGVYQSDVEVKQAIQAIRAMGVPESSIQTIAPLAQDSQAEAELLGRLCQAGFPEDEARSYLEGMRQGSHLLVVTADELTTQTAYDQLKSHGLIDTSERATEQRMLERQAGADDPYFTPSETVDSLSGKWQQSNKVITAVGTAAGTAQGAIIGTAIAGPLGTAIGAVTGALIGAGAGAAVDATVEAVKEEDAVRHDAAAREAHGGPPAHERPEGQAKEQGQE